MTATDLRTRTRRSRIPAAGEPPRSVRAATTILYVLLFLALVYPVAFLGVTVVSMVRSNSIAMEQDLMIACGLALAAVIIGGFCQSLIKRTRRGRRRAWLALLALLSLIALVGAFVMMSIMDGAAAGFAVVLVSLILIGMLAGTRRARAYFRKPARI